MRIALHRNMPGFRAAPYKSRSCCKALDESAAQLVSMHEPADAIKNQITARDYAKKLRSVILQITHLAPRLHYRVQQQVNVLGDDGALEIAPGPGIRGSPYHREHGTNQRETRLAKTYL